jgi:hypothetical protein
MAFVPGARVRLRPEAGRLFPGGAGLSPAAAEPNRLFKETSL